MCPPTSPDRKSKRSSSTSTSYKANFVGFPMQKNDMVTAVSTSTEKCSSTVALKDTASNSFIRLTTPSIFCIFLISSSFPFILGCYIRNYQQMYIFHRNMLALSSSPLDDIFLTGMSIPRINVPPTMATTISLPFSSHSKGTRYIFENFSYNLSVAVASSRSVMIDLDGNAYDFAGDTSILPRKTSFIQRQHSDPNTFDSEDVTHFAPTGQHILVDIEHVDPDFLRSEERLSQALVELIRGRTDMTLLSYHCHSKNAIDISGGISCVGVLLESHVSFHTFPSFGSIMLDLFSCGETSLLPLLLDVKQLFAISSLMLSSSTRSLVEHSPTSNQVENTKMNSTTNSILLHGATPSIEQPRTHWNFKRRGFRTESLSVATELPDLHWMLSMRTVDKTHVATVQTIFQRIDIYDMKNIPTRPKEQNDRIIFLDGIIQSRSIGEHAYHEALVHPVMFCHDAPKRVVIIGGGEGATLREVLKHKSVQEVIMVEIDEIMVRTSQTYLPEWSDCTFSGHASCFDDPRTTVYFSDAIAWFVNHFGYNATIDPITDIFDIIIMDALDPDSVLEFSDFLYKNRELMFAFSRALGDGGIFIAQVGEVEVLDDLPSSFHPNDQLGTFLEGLESFGFESIVDYEESHGRFIESWGFVVAMKDSESRANWFRNEAEINFQISKRVLDAAELHFFDGATMMQYQYTSRIDEEIWCRDKFNGECSTGHGFDPYVTNLPQSDFVVKPSTVVKGGRGVFATKFISKGTMIGLEECVNGMFLPSTSLDLMRNAAEETDKDGVDQISDFWEVVFWGYIDGYGWVDSVYGLPAGGVDPGIMTFVNHGCNGTYNVGTPLPVNEMTAKLGVGPFGIYDDENDVYNPYNERQFPFWECEKFVTLRDIEAGEELFDNYLVFGGGADVEDWDKNLMELKSVCSGASGTIAEYEAAACAKVEQPLTNENKLNS